MIHRVRKTTEVSEMITGKSIGEIAASHDEAKKLMDDAGERARKAFKEAKKQADIVREEAKKLAVDKQAKEEVEKAYKEAVKTAEKLRDAIIGEAMAVFRDHWKQSDMDSQKDIAKSKERADQVKIAYKEDKKRADMVYKEAKKMAVGKEAKKAADQAYKEARAQAKKGRGEVTT
jgi:hypothetical protein